MKILIITVTLLIPVVISQNYIGTNIVDAADKFIANIKHVGQKTQFRLENGISAKIDNLTKVAEKVIKKGNLILNNIVEETKTALNNISNEPECLEKCINPQKDFLKRFYEETNGKIEHCANDKVQHVLQLRQDTSDKVKNFLNKVDVIEGKFKQCHTFAEWTAVAEEGIALVTSIPGGIQSLVKTVGKTICETVPTVRKCYKTLYDETKAKESNIINDATTCYQNLKK